MLKAPLQIPKALEACVQKFCGSVDKDEEDFDQYAQVAELLNFHMANFKSYSTFASDMDSFLKKITKTEESMKLDIDEEKIDSFFLSYGLTWKSKFKEEDDLIQECRHQWNALQIRAVTTRRALSGEERGTKALVLKSMKYNGHQIDNQEDVTIIGESTQPLGTYTVRDNDGHEFEVPKINLIRQEEDQNFQASMSRARIKLKAAIASMQSAMDMQFWKFLINYLNSRSNKDFIHIENKALWNEIINNIRQENKRKQHSRIEECLSTIKENTVAKKLPSAYSISEKEATLLKTLTEVYNNAMCNIQAFMDATFAVKKDANWASSALQMLEIQVIKSFFGENAKFVLDRETTLTTASTKPKYHQQQPEFPFEKISTENEMTAAVTTQNVLQHSHSEINVNEMEHDGTKIRMQSKEERIQQSSLLIMTETRSRSSSITERTKVQSLRKTKLVDCATQHSLERKENSMAAHLDLYQPKMALSGTTEYEEETLHKKMTKRERSEVTSLSSQEQERVFKGSRSEKPNSTKNVVECGAFEQIQTSAGNMYHNYRKPITQNGAQLLKDFQSSSSQSHIKKFEESSVNYKQKIALKTADALFEHGSKQAFVVTETKETVNTHLSHNYKAKIDNEQSALEHGTKQAFVVTETKESVNTHLSHNYKAKIDNEQSALEHGTKQSFVLATKESLNSQLCYNHKAKIDNEQSVLEYGIKQSSIYITKETRNNKVKYNQKIDTETTACYLSQETGNESLKFEQSTVDTKIDATKRINHSNICHKEKTKTDSTAGYLEIQTETFGTAFKEEIPMRTCKAWREVGYSHDFANVLKEASLSHVAHCHKKDIQTTETNKELAYSTNATQKRKDYSLQGVNFHINVPISNSGMSYETESEEISCKIGREVQDMQMTHHQKFYHNETTTFLEKVVDEDSVQFAEEHPVQCRGISREIAYTDGNASIQIEQDDSDIKTLGHPLVDNGVFRINDEDYRDSSTEMLMTSCDTGAFCITHLRSVKLQSNMRVPQVDCGVGGNIVTPSYETAIQTIHEEVPKTTVETSAYGEQKQQSVTSTRGTDMSCDQLLCDTGACATSTQSRKEKVEKITVTKQKKVESTPKNVVESGGDGHSIVKRLTKTEPKYRDRKKSSGERESTILEDEIRHLLITTEEDDPITIVTTRPVRKEIPDEEWRYPRQRTDFRPPQGSLPKPSLTVFEPADDTYIPMNQHASPMPMQHSPMPMQKSSMPMQQSPMPMQQSPMPMQKSQISLSHTPMPMPHEQQPDFRRSFSARNNLPQLPYDTDPSVQDLPMDFLQQRSSSSVRNRMERPANSQPKSPRHLNNKNVPQGTLINRQSNAYKTMPNRYGSNPRFYADPSSDDPNLYDPTTSRHGSQVLVRKEMTTYHEKSTRSTSNGVF